MNLRVGLPHLTLRPRNLRVLHPHPHLILRPRNIRIGLPHLILHPMNLRVGLPHLILPPMNLRVGLPHMSLPRRNLIAGLSLILPPRNLKAGLPHLSLHPRNEIPAGVDQKIISIDDQLLTPGEIFTTKFDTRGRYQYYCGSHRSAGMSDSVTVI